MTDTPDTLFEQSAQLSAAGDLVGARAKLDLASREGHVEANYRLAISESAGFGGPVDKARALRRLQAISAHYAPARLFQSVAMASGWDGREDWQGAAELVVGAAKAGDPAAQFDTALLCLLRDPAAMLNDAQLCLTSALKQGAHFAAPALMRLHALKGEAFLPPAQLLKTLEGVQYVPIAQLAEVAQAQSTPAVAATGAPDFARIAEALQSTPETWRTASSQQLSGDANIRAWDGVLHPCICDFLAGNAGAALRQAQVFDPVSGELIDHPSRRALQAGLQPYMQTLLTHAVERMLCEMAGQPWTHAERLTILLYRPGDYYAPHADYFSENTPADEADMAASGQRVATALISLHPAKDGGATHFPHLDVTWRGEMGGALTFDNVNADGRPNPMSYHEGQVVNAGWKSLASLWIREKPYQGPVLKTPDRAS